MSESKSDPSRPTPKKRNPSTKKIITDPIDTAPETSVADSAAFESFQLHPSLVKNCKRLGFKKPTDIQTDAIPVVMTRQDVIGLAQTGTGKTAAYLLPAMHHLLQKPSMQQARALVLAPTRELALQIEKDFVEFAKETSLKCVCILGGKNIGPQIKKLKAKVDMIIATPGRLLDHLERGTCSLKTIEILILDESDRMLDMGFLPDVKTLIRKTPQTRQTLMFSATMPSAIKHLCREIQQDPVTVQVAVADVPDSVKHSLYWLPQNKKTDLLVELLLNTNWETVLVFTRTKHRADILHHTLKEAGVSVDKIHGDRSMNERLRALESFRLRKFRVLIATDIASRGLDIKDISHVVNYDVPNGPEDYVHRVGRTGRADSEGDAFTFASIEEANDIKSIEALLGKTIPVLVHPTYHYPGDLKRFSETPKVVAPIKGRGLSASRNKTRRGRRR